MTKRLRRFCVGFVLLVGLTVALWASRRAVLSWGAEWLDVGAEPRPVDAVLVLPGDEQVRPFVAASLVRAGLADRVLIPQTVLSPQSRDGITTPSHEVIRQVMEHEAIPGEQVLLLKGSTDSTFGDVRALGGFLRSSPQSRVAVVTSWYHTRRARWAFRHLLSNSAAARLVFVSAPADTIEPNNWWQTEKGLRMVLGEYTKLLYYVVRYGTALYWVSGAALALFAWLAYRRVRAGRSAPRAGAVG